MADEITSKVQTWLQRVEEIELLQEIDETVDLDRIHSDALKELGVAAGRIFDLLPGPVIKSFRTKIFGGQWIRLKPGLVKAVR